MFDRLIDLIVQFINLFRFFCVIRDFEGGCILRLGKFHRMARRGWNWMIPFDIEECFFTTIVPETMIIGPQSLVTKDGKQVIASTVVTFKVIDPKTFLLEISGALQTMEDASYGAIATTIMTRTWQELCEMDISNEAAKAIRKQAKRYGVEVIQAQIADLTLSRSIRLIQEHPNKFSILRGA